MSILFDNPSPAIGCGDPGDPIDFGCLFDGSGELAKTFAEAGNRQEMTILVRLKLAGLPANQRAVLSANAGENRTGILISNSRLELHGDGAIRCRSAALSRDYAGHTSIVLHLQSGNADAAQRAAFFVDLKKIPVTFPAAIPLGWNSGFFSATQHAISGLLSPGDNRLSGCVSEVIAIEGALVAPEEFDYVTSYGHVRAKRFAGTGGGAAVYGQKGFHLDFADPLDLGKDISGNGNHFTAGGLTANNQVKDTPSKNYAVLNVLNQVVVAGSGGSTLSNGNLKSTGPAGGNSGSLYMSTILARKGKIYAEVTVLAVSSANVNVVLGPASLGRFWSTNNTVLLSIYGTAADSSIQKDGVIVQTNLPGWSNSNVCGIEMNLDDLTVQFFRNNNPYGNPVAIPDIGIALGIYTSRDSLGNVSVAEINYGQKPFVYPRGTDFLTYNSDNMPCPDVLIPDNYVTTRERTGGADVADLPWNSLVGKTFHMAKRLDAASNFRVTCTELGDSLAINCNVGGAEVASSHAYTAGGISVGADTEYQGQVLHQFWRASPKAGADFVLVEHVNGTPTVFTQATGGLFDYAEVYPLSGGDIRAFHKDMASGEYMILNDVGSGTDTGWLTRTANTGTLGAQMASGQYLIRMHRAVPQFCAVTSGKGTGVVDGMFVSMDFEPRIFVGKDGSDGLYNWAMYCSDIAEGNPVSKSLRFNLDTAVYNGAPIDMNSNGVKARNTDNFINKLNTTYRCIAWAKTPGKFARA